MEVKIYRYNKNGTNSFVLLERCLLFRGAPYAPTKYEEGVANCPLTRGLFSMHGKAFGEHPLYNSSGVFKRGYKCMGV